jgi:UDP-2,3-diacylglucosamine pyrophosphatase LpxH
MLKKAHYRTVVISDVHLGTKGSKAKELVRFLKATSCERLILNGDIIDGWQLKKSGEWKKKHTRFFRVVIKMMEKKNTEVIYLRGNHDDFLDNVMPFSVGNLHIQREYILESQGRKYLVLHGDIFDAITTNLRWLAKVGDVGYTLLLWINKVYNQRRMRQGKPYYSLSHQIKLKVKSAVSYISDYEKELVAFARKRHCQGVICGHIHHAVIQQYDDILYLNSGDWVESLSALVETFEGEWHILHYNDLVEKEKEQDKA